MRLYFVLTLLFLLAIHLSGSGQAPENRPGTIHIKLKERFGSMLTLSAGTGKFGLASLDAAAREIRTESVKRIFSRSDRFEKAHKQFGLHLWYEVQFDKSIPVDRAVQLFAILEEVEKAEAVLKLQLPQPIQGNGTFETKEKTRHRTSNDPLFYQQWYLNNTGQTGGIRDADIDVNEAWDITTGSPGVIVAVVDGGIDFNHLDLAGSGWNNDGEIAANGIDDDGNGYVDDLHGYNFADQSPIITPNLHGTHVGGTIGAVTNNGIGISGIAAGDGAEAGVRLMTLEIFGSNVGGAEEAFVYAADNGAVIINNSWAGGGNAIEAAIQYFIARAGFDNSDENFAANIQTGPMRGGLVIFAAGNSSASYGYPAALPEVMAVAASDHRDLKALFSNYGRWVDITAPGVDVFSTGYSIINNNEYVSLSGTSMAAPCVSGVAALLVSQLKGADLYPNQVWDRILAGADNINLKNPVYADYLGAGRLNAKQSLDPGVVFTVNAISDLSAETTTSAMILRWTAPGASNPLGKVTKYDVRLSHQQINGDNFDAAVRVFPAYKPGAPGTTEELILNDYKYGQKYYIAIRSMDMYGNLSDLSNIVELTTLGPPEIQILPSYINEELPPGSGESYPVVLRNTGESRLDLSYSIEKSVSKQSQARLFDYRDGKLYEINVLDSSIVAEVPIPPYYKHDLSAFDGRYLYFYNYPYAYRMLPETGEIKGRVQLNCNALTHSGEYLYVARHTDTPDETIYEVDFDRQSTVRTLNIIWRVTSRLVYSGRRQSIFCYHPNDGGCTKVTELHVDGTILRTFCLERAGRIEYSERLGKLLVIADNTVDVYDPDAGTRESSYHLEGYASVVTDEPILPWLQAVNKKHTLAPGEESVMSVTVRTGPSEETLTGRINLLVNDPDNPRPHIPVDITVSGTGGLEVSLPAIDFGTIYENETPSVVLQIRNQGTEALSISSATIEGPFTISSFQSQIPGRSRTPVTVGFAVSPAGTYEGKLNLVSVNNEGMKTVTVTLYAEVIKPPVIQVSPLSIEATLSNTETSSQPIAITNLGLSTLTTRHSFRATYPGKTEKMYTTYYGTQSAILAEVDPATGNILRSFQSPLPYKETRGTFDGTYLYLVKNSTMICKINPATGKIEESMNLGETGNHIYGIAHSGRFIYALIGDAIYEIDFAKESIVRTINTVKSGYGMTRIATGGSRGSLFLTTHYTMEVYEVDLATGALVNTIQLNGTSNYIGSIQYSGQRNILFITSFEETQALDADTGEYLYTLKGLLTDVLTDATGERWIALEQKSAEVLPGENKQYEARFNPTGLVAGEYKGIVRINSNDPLLPVQDVEATLTVNGKPELWVSTKQLNFGDLYVKTTKELPFKIVNSGTDELSIDAITSDNPNFVIEFSPFTLKPRSGKTITVKFGTETPHFHAGNIVIESNDQRWVIQLSGQTIPAPKIEVTPQSISVELAQNQSATEKLVLNNAGENILNGHIELYSIPYSQGSLMSFSKNPESGSFALAVHDPATLAITEWMPLPETLPDNEYIFSIDDSFIYYARAGYESGVYKVSRSSGTVVSYSSFSFNYWLSNLTYSGTHFYSADSYQIWELDEMLSPKQIASHAFGYVSSMAYGGNRGTIFILHSNPNAAGGYLTEYDFSTNSIVKSYQASGDQVAFSEALGILYIQGSFRLTALDVNTGLELSSLKTLEYRTPLAADGVGRKWLKTGTSSFSLQPANDIIVPIEINANMDKPGTYKRAVTLKSNDPAAPQVVIPVTLKVLDIALSTPQELRNVVTFVPNPFDGAALVNYTLATSGHVEFLLTDSQGRNIARVPHGYRQPGAHAVQYDGSALPTGLYFYRLTVDGKPTGSGKVLRK